VFSYLKKLGKKLKAPPHATAAEKAPLSKSLEENIDAMLAVFGEDNDFVVRKFEVSAMGGASAALFFIDGLVGSDCITQTVLRPLMTNGNSQNPETNPFSTLEELGRALLLSGEVEAGRSLEGALVACLSGDTVLMAEGFAEYVCINTKGFEKRAISEPQTETVVRGPREGFTEVLRTNSSLIRRRLKTSHLRMDMMKVGQKTHTVMCLCYLDNVADPKLIAEVKARLKTIDTDAILSSGYVEEFIEDAPSSIFQTINYTEKPDIVAAKLLEGRCALIIDGAPFVLTMPMLFIENFQSPEDYSTRPYIASFLRLIRAAAFFISLVAPAMYVALTSFHQELIPTTLLFTIAASSEGTPFSSVIETAIMLLTFEIMKEAGIRLPKPIGQAVSIVGALVMGQAAIQAGLVGAPVVIVIAFTAVSGFLIPNISDVISILRWYLLLLASIIGGFGIVLGLLTLLFHLAALRSFGALYLYPYAPYDADGMKDSLVRLPIWKMRKRPGAFNVQDEIRQNAKKPSFGKDGNL